MEQRTEVSNQNEFDICVANENIAVVVDCSVVASGNSRVVASGNSSVVASGNSRVVASGKVFIRLFSASKIKASNGVVILKHCENDKTPIEGGRVLDVVGF